MQRRDLNAALAAAGLLAGLPRRGLASPLARLSEAPWRAIEQAAGGRRGVAVLETGSGRLEGYRLDERSARKQAASRQTVLVDWRGTSKTTRMVRFGQPDCDEPLDQLELLGLWRHTIHPDPPARRVAPRAPSSLARRRLPAPSPAGSGVDAPRSPSTTVGDAAPARSDPPASECPEHVWR